MFLIKLVYKMNFLTKSLFFSIIIFQIIILSCKKDDDFLTDGDAKLNFSADLVTFDTIFTTVSTSTRQITVYNPQNQRIKISSIRLANGNQSYFSLNINGMATNSATNIEIEAKDSIFIFIKANINPNNQNNPLLVTDSIIFETNGNIQDIDIVACGQDAHFIIADKTIGNQLKYKIVAKQGEIITWNNDKPYVIYGYAVIDSTAKLTINAGCRIYLHKNSGVWVYKGGNIKVLGTYNEPVTFQGDRREAWYANATGQWDRIWINEGNEENEINYAIIKNGFIGIQTEILGETPMAKNKLKLTNTIIKNMSGYGIYSRNFEIDATNNVISGCGLYSVYLSLGGKYNFVHNTIANYWNGSNRNTPAVYISNFFNTNYTTYLNDLNATFGNCIITGNQTEELEFDKNSEVSFVTKFDHCIIKTSLNDATFEDCLRNVDPLFKSQENENFNIYSDSPAKNTGNPIYGTIAPVDIRQFSRDGQPDIGAYEYDVNSP